MSEKSIGEVTVKPRRPSYAEVIGWASAYFCSQLDAFGRDPRAVEIPAVIEAFERAYPGALGAVMRDSKEGDPENQFVFESFLGPLRLLAADAGTTFRITRRDAQLACIDASSGEERWERFRMATGIVGECMKEAGWAKLREGARRP